MGERTLIIYSGVYRYSEADGSAFPNGEFHSWGGDPNVNNWAKTPQNFATSFGIDMERLADVNWHGANQIMGNLTFSSGYTPMIQVWKEIPIYDQKVDLYFYPTLNVENVPEDWKVDVYYYPMNNIEENQEHKILFYPDGNIGEDQEHKVMFYPDGNVSDAIVNQRLDISFYDNGNVGEDQEVQLLFYPDGNLEDVEVPVIDGIFKFWFGMKGKKKYGKGHIKRIRL